MVDFSFFLIASIPAVFWPRNRRGSKLCHRHRSQRCLFAVISVSFSIYLPKTDGNQDAKRLVVLDDDSSAKKFQSVCLFAARYTDWSATLMSSFPSFNSYFFSQFYILKVSLLTEMPYRLQAFISPPKSSHNFSVTLQHSTAKTDGNRQIMMQ